MLPPSMDWVRKKRENAFSILTKEGYARLRKKCFLENAFVNYSFLHIRKLPGPTFLLPACTAADFKRSAREA